MHVDTIVFISFKSRGFSMPEIQSFFSQDDFNLNDFLVSFIV